MTKERYGTATRVVHRRARGSGDADPGPRQHRRQRRHGHRRRRGPERADRRPGPAADDRARSSCSGSISRAPIAHRPRRTANGTYTFNITERGPYQISGVGARATRRARCPFVIDRTGGVGDLGSTIPLRHASSSRSWRRSPSPSTPPEARPAAAVAVAVTGTPTIAPAATLDGGRGLQRRRRSRRVVPVHDHQPQRVPAGDRPGRGRSRPDVGGHRAAHRDHGRAHDHGDASAGSGGTRVACGPRTARRRSSATVTGSDYTITRVPNGTGPSRPPATRVGGATSPPVGVLSTTGQRHRASTVPLTARQVAISFTDEPGQRGHRPRPAGPAGRRPVATSR